METTTAEDDGSNRNPNQGWERGIAGEVAAAWLDLATIPAAHKSSEEAAAHAQDADRQAEEAEKRYREQRSAFEAQWLQREEDMRRRLLDLHHAEMENILQAPDTPNEEVGTQAVPNLSSGDAGKSDAPASAQGGASLAVSGPSSAPGTPGTPVRRVVKVPQSPPSRAKAISIEILSQLAAQLKNELRGEADALRQRMMAQMVQELRAHQLAIAQQAELHGKLALQREETLRRTTLSVTHRLLGYARAHT